MKKVISISLLLLLTLSIRAQQDPMYSLYMFNGLVINPAYAGSREAASLTLVGRRQWTGLNGAPSTAALGFHAPSRNDRNGYGLTFVYDQFGIHRRSDLRLAYALRVSMEKGHWVSLGLQGGFDLLQSNYSLVDVRDPNDLAFTGNQSSLLRPAAGLGIYYNSDRAYAGLSVPNVIPYSLHQKAQETLKSRRYTHYMLTAGVALPLGESVRFKPSFLLKMVKGAPVSLDLNASFLFADRIWLGASWRMKESVVGIVELQVTRQLRLAYAYDYSISGLSAYQSGGHELMLGFDLGVEKNRMLSPRNF